MRQRIFNVLILLAVCGLGTIQCLGYISTNDKEPKDSLVNAEVMEVKPTFFTKSPEDGLKEALNYYGVKHPEIVYAQAILETGNFTSEGCLVDNNLFGLYDSKRQRYYSFDNWTESVVAYLDYVQHRYKPPNDYYKFLSDIGYAEDPEYINKLKRIVNQYDKRRATDTVSVIN